jgi:hypothetical protein
MPVFTRRSFVQGAVISLLPARTPRLRMLVALEAHALGFLIQKFPDSSINLGPKPVLHQDGTIRLPKFDNHSMGTIFEVKPGEHFTQTTGTLMSPKRTHC